MVRKPTMPQLLTTNAKYCWIQAPTPLIWQKLIPLLKSAVVADQVPIGAFYRKYLSRLNLGKKHPCCLTCQYNFQPSLEIWIVCSSNYPYIYKNCNQEPPLSFQSVNLIQNFVFLNESCHFLLCLIFVWEIFKCLWNAVEHHGYFLQRSKYQNPLLHGSGFSSASHPVIPGHSPAQCRWSISS